MKKISAYRVRKESLAAMRKAQGFYPALEIQFRDRSGIHTHTLSAGYDDDLFVYRESGETYVLSLNTRLGYVGLQCFDGSTEVESLFLQEGQVEETIGRLEYAPWTIIRRLLEYINP